MRTSAAHKAISLTLSGARLALAQDVAPSSDTVGQPLDVVTNSVPKVSAPVPDGPVTETRGDRPGEIVQANPGTASSELTEPSSEVQEDTQTLETSLATSSETDGINSSGTPTGASENPSATDEDDNDDEIILVEDPALLDNSTEPYLPAEIADEHILEEENNGPITIMTKKEAREIAVLEGRVRR
ncbi:uncharacterized protein F5Z01DRAFT_190515 [Emericellopsis atlantica]|uniref:Uncharacterized protein n=1 Tax=Emericellopsis atlantica TaxID=2614577 RepID=A0A9P8CNC6_9HYPO|nr:uncharacterized protein F5Z01DRAFT_190515 [Emericellopsis atlantica]KAG9252915.1 hypothetical protein F5Z01DRAFT_190515 [Emericellopsis atlantica]